jgi:hypothetical protein
MTIGRDNLTKAETVTIAAIETSVPLLIVRQWRFERSARSRCCDYVTVVQWPDRGPNHESMTMCGVGG